MDFISTATFVTVALLFLVYYALHMLVFRTWNYFAHRDMVFVRGAPLMGTFAAAMLGREPLATRVHRIYTRYSKHKYIGVYMMGGQPVYLVNDPELIKAITVKDFDHFVNRGFQLDERIDPLFGRNLFNMTDDRWRNMRSILSPLFTGSKMRSMLALMNDSIAEFVADIGEEVAAAGAVGREYALMKIYSSSTTDVIATCAFGLKTNSFRNPDNEFFTLGQQVAYAFQSPKLFLSSCMPTLAKLLRLQTLTQSETDFFRDIVNHNVAQRKKNGIVRHDLLHLMMLMRDGRLDSIDDKDEHQNAGFATVPEILSAKSTEKLKNFTDDDFVAQCMVFFLAGFAGAANTLCFLSYELALNAGVQQKLYDEIAEAHAALGGKPLTYEVLQKMKYLDMVVTETLRQWTLNVVMVRQVAKQYVLQGDDGHKAVLQPGDIVWIPNCGIQHDARYYAEPNKFDPERFAPDNRTNIDTSMYMPFGAGPRACIASRFALMHVKASVFHLLLNFRLECGPNTQVPCKIANTTVILEPDAGQTLLFKRRNAQ